MTFCAKRAVNALFNLRTRVANFFIDLHISLNVKLNWINYVLLAHAMPISFICFMRLGFFPQFDKF